jgi:hypothetical protein
VAAGLPDGGGHDDGGFEAGDVVALAGHGVPPEFLDVALEFGAQRAVIPKAVDAAVNFGRLKNEPAPLAQRHDFFHLIAFPEKNHAEIVMPLGVVRAQLQILPILADGFIPQSFPIKTPQLFFMTTLAY